ncbi:hypothetical protein [Streptomyces wuyuanensis]|uniref:hypothetical protein n=1 Tax=Streptomyces wuyuanensis TaxID=1196353 RepID=UPI00369801C8
MATLAKRWKSVSAAMVAGALVISGCSAAERHRSTASPTTATPSRTSRPPLTAEQLKALAFKDSEVPQANSVPVQDPLPETQKPNFPPVSDASCQRAFDVLHAETSAAHVIQIFNWKENLMGGGSTLASYEGVEAREAFRRLQDALKTCKSFTGVAWAGEYSAKITVEKAPDVGDEALSFHLIMPMPEVGGRDEHHVFVRVGDATAHFTELNLGQKAQFPVDLVKQQVDRLSSAQHR